MGGGCQRKRVGPWLLFRGRGKKRKSTYPKSRKKRASERERILGGGGKASDEKKGEGGLMGPKVGKGRGGGENAPLLLLN